MMVSTLLAMLAFAGNSVLCRIALLHTAIDPASFTTIRMLAGAVTLYFIARRNHLPVIKSGSWRSALVLFIYAGGFSFAYKILPTATGALLLFGSVQSVMIGYGIWHGERFHPIQSAGLSIAMIGLIVLLLPGLTMPTIKGGLLMLAAGIGWAMYTLRGKYAGNPLSVSAGNFIRVVPITLCLSLLNLEAFSYDHIGIIYAILSGALTSGVGYAIWYSVLPHLKTSHAAAIQLSVPVLATAGGVLILHESLPLNLLFATILILGGIALVMKKKSI